jgi:hypothetical protein
LAIFVPYSIIKESKAFHAKWCAFVGHKCNIPIALHYYYCIIPDESSPARGRKWWKNFAVRFWKVITGDQFENGIKFAQGFMRCEPFEPGMRV